MGDDTFIMVSGRDRETDFAIVEKRCAMTGIKAKPEVCHFTTGNLMINLET